MNTAYQTKYLVRFVYLRSMKFFEKYKNEVELSHLEKRKDVQVLHYQKITKGEMK